MKHESLHAARRRSQSLRYRLLTLVLVPLLLLSGTVILLAFKWSSDYTYEQLFTKVNTDLRVAGDSFSRIQRSGQIELYWLANSVPLRQYLATDNLDGLLELLEQRRRLAGFDFLKLWTGDAQRALHAGGWIGSGIRHSELTAKVISNNGLVSAQADAVSGIEILYPEDWKREGVSEDKVLLPLVPTARAAPSDRKTEDRAMVIRTLQPVLDNQGRAVALLEAGLLLNRNFQFVDQIRDLVYGPGSLAPGSRGTVTVFLEDVRITTNVPASDESRALGTRVSKEVKDAVLNRGESWVNRALSLMIGTSLPMSRLSMWQERALECFTQAIWRRPFVNNCSRQSPFCPHWCSRVVYLQERRLY
jgi:two-component system NtrC family sensor kinase